MLITFSIATKSLWKQKFRSMLTILAMSIGIAAVIMVFSAGEGLRSFVSSEIETFGSGIIQVEIKVPNTGKTSSENAQGIAQGISITSFKNDDVEAIRNHQNISHSYGAVIAQESVSYEDHLKKNLIMGTGFEADVVSNYELLYGRFYEEDEEKSKAQVVVLGYKIWKDIFIDENPVGQKIKIDGKKFRIIGVLKEKGSAFFFDLDNILYIPVTTVQEKMLGTDYVSYATSKMIDPSKGKSTQEDIIEIMREQHDITNPDKDDFSVNTMDEAEDILGSVIESITILLIALVCISLIVGGVGIMNIMYVSVAERTFEIGLRKSLGAKNSQILNQFLLESVTITFFGGIFGIIIGILLSYLVAIIATNSGFTWIFSIPQTSIILSISFSLFVGLLFGLYPAKKAANLNPIEALKKN
ncbi:ABC transporter permease [Patescibacteria group bacterium]|nr:ABC transporter permease [Patescibacteria group bacterium]MBU1721358.1 ABC transporter permease [Patescibacteria group bacterium]MBU1901566.1 ABC transporter permease [Patescibacteria group bacterium]